MSGVIVFIINILSIIIAPKVFPATSNSFILPQLPHWSFIVALVFGILYLLFGSLTMSKEKRYFWGILLIILGIIAVWFALIMNSVR